MISRHTHSIKANAQLKRGEERKWSKTTSVLLYAFIASMAGDSETRVDSQAENENAIRQPFLIGVAGGTASGKVGIVIFIN